MRLPRRDEARRAVGSPLLLLGLAASFLVTAYAGQRLLAEEPVAITVWIVGAALVHDLVVLPAYTALFQALGWLTARHRGGPAHRAVLNAFRVPTAVSLLLLAVYWPLILRRTTRFTPHTGLPTTPFLWSWLAVTAVLFALSGGWLALRLHRLRDR